MAGVSGHVQRVLVAFFLALCCVQDAGAQTELLARNISVGDSFACALTYENTIKCWGATLAYLFGAGTSNSVAIGNGPGEMGNNLLPIDLGTGLQVQKMCRGRSSASGPHNCAIFTNGRLKCWGFNSLGQLGLNDTAARGDAAGEMGDSLPFVELGYNADGSPLLIKEVACGGSFTCAILENDKVKCWGSNQNGKLGLGLSNAVRLGDAANEMGNLLPYVDVGTNKIVTSIELGDQFICATVKSQGDQYSSVKCWGSNAVGQLGTGTSVASLGSLATHMGDNLLPVNLGTVSLVKSISSGHSHTCALLSNDKVKCWGENGFEQLGLGLGYFRDIWGRTSEMGDSLPEVSLGSSFTPSKLSVTSTTSCAISTNNIAKCWGHCSHGICNGNLNTEYIGYESSQMGDNLLPVPFAAGQYPLEIAAYQTHACAVLNTNQVKCWGADLVTGILGLGIEEPDGIFYEGGPVSNPYTIDLGTTTAAAPSAAPSSSPSPSFSSSYNFSIGATVCYACLPGSYSPSIGSANCSSCQPGYYQNLQAQDECEACPAGTYNPSTASSDISSCQACRKGTYSGATAQSGESTCQQCPAGYFNFYTGQTSQSDCKECPAGTHSSQDGSTCIPCATGYYSSSSASAQCTAADPGYRTVANTNYWSPECASNNNTCTMASSEKFVLGSTSQTICLAGTYSPGTTDVCTACNPGTSSTAEGASSISTCQNCAAGTYAVNSSTATCTPCGPGYYGTVSGSSSNSTCIQCSAGTYSSMEIATECQPCGPGRWGNQTARYNINQCFLCPAGTFSTAQIITASTQCVKCSAGYFSSQQGAQNNGTCEECPSGTYSTEPGITIADECIRCQAGKYSTAWAASSPSTCQNCQPGTFSQAVGANNQSYCTVCGFGNFSDVPGATQCKQCDRGTYSNRTGQASNGTCIPCRAGTWSDQIGADAESDCILCGLGKYSITMGAINANTCLDCGEGKYNNVTGAGSELFCRRCPVGTFLDTKGNDNINDCYACPAGMSNNAEGSDGYLDCIKCDPGYFSGSAQSAECLPCDAGYSTTFDVKSKVMHSVLK